MNYQRLVEVALHLKLTSPQLALLKGLVEANEFMLEPPAISDGLSRRRQFDDNDGPSFDSPRRHFS